MDYDDDDPQLHLHESGMLEDIFHEFFDEGCSSGEDDVVPGKRRGRRGGYKKTARACP